MLSLLLRRRAMMINKSVTVSRFVDGEYTCPYGTAHMADGVATGHLGGQLFPLTSPVSFHAGDTITIKMRNDATLGWMGNQLHLHGQMTINFGNGGAAYRYEKSVIASADGSFDAWYISTTGQDTGTGTGTITRIYINDILVAGKDES